jgi:hypothetical protein
MSEVTEVLDQVAFWRKHSDAWKASGRTQQMYCEQEGIICLSFMYQHTKLIKKAKQNGMQFVEAKAESSTINNQTPGLQLMLPNGVRIGITNEVNVGLLHTVLTLIEHLLDAADLWPRQVGVGNQLSTHPSIKSLRSA